MQINLLVNGQYHSIDVTPGEKLLSALRRLGFFSVKHGCESGECGACAVRLDGRLVNSCQLLALQAVDHRLETVEAMGEHPQQGWKTTQGLHRLQDAFVESGAIQCGYCTPAQLLAAAELLEANPNPSEDEVREALSGVLCRCTGYLKPVQAVLRAASFLRGEDPDEQTDGSFEMGLEPFQPYPDSPASTQPPGYDGEPTLTSTVLRVMPRVQSTPETEKWKQVGKPEKKVDAVKLVQGKPAFTADIEKRGMLVAKVLHSPHAHAIIRSIDASRARALPGVAAVLTWRDVPRVVFSTAGQSDPIPGPLDTFSLDNRVRFVGDRVALVAAETEEIANQALSLIDVDYELLPALFDPAQAMSPEAPRLHDEPEYVNFAELGPHAQPGSPHSHRHR